MWTLVLAAADAAGAEPAAVDPAELPWRVEDAEVWNASDRRATRVARAGAWTAGIGGLAIAAGSGLVAAAEGDVGDLGVLLGAAGAIAGYVGPPIALAGSLRAQRSLQERGVFVPPGAAIAGWTLYATGAVAIPSFFVVGVTDDSDGAFVVATAWYASLVALPLAQVDLNRRGREAAGLAPLVARERALPVLAVVPARRGVALAGTF
jgi:hypothetical protein